MLIKETFADVQTTANGKESSMSTEFAPLAHLPSDSTHSRSKVTYMTWYLTMSTARNLLVPSHHPWIPQCVSTLIRVCPRSSTYTVPSRFPGVVLFSEIYQGEMVSSPAPDQQLTMCVGFVS
jgi:hypothetical protein